MLHGAEEAQDVVEEIAKRREHVGVIPPGNVVRFRDRVLYNQAAALSLAGIPVALQSGAEDGARNLPLVALYGVQHGLGGDAALRALTVGAAKLYRIDDHVGVLEPGRSADLLIHSGYPFDPGSRIETVIIAGEEVPHGHQ